MNDTRIKETQEIAPNRKVYDIRTVEAARQTLDKLTGVPIAVWEEADSFWKRKQAEVKYIDIDEDIKKVIQQYGEMPCSYMDFEFIFTHITTSANACISLCKNGILNLKSVLYDQNSELKKFLENNRIFIDIDKHDLFYDDKHYDIAYNGKTMISMSAESRIGRKIYSDYGVCGFLSMEKVKSYPGRVHERPEILMDVDNLLKLNLSAEWKKEHELYEVVAKVSGERIDTDNDVFEYLMMAYNNAFCGINENILLIKRNLQIPATDILEIRTPT